MMLADGLEYKRFDYKASRVHLAMIDLTKRTVRPVLAADAFPFLRIYPIKNAIEQGAIVSVGGGFNTQWSHDQGVADQPLHALVVDDEIWTTGTGGGGYGLLIADSAAWVQQNHIQVHVWRPDNTVIDVEHVNHGHEGRVVAFTRRGGTNEYPMNGDQPKHYATLTPLPSGWTDYGDNMRRNMIVSEVGMDPHQPVEDEVVLEAKWTLKLTPGDVVMWNQNFGAPARYVTSGWPGIIRAGVNVVPELDLQGVESQGPDNWFVRKNPRMVIGVDETHTIMTMAVVEGRIPGSVGLRLKEFATMLLHHGVYDAVNFDGGGSAFMWILPGGLVAPGCYNTSETIDGLRPDHYATAVF